MLAHSLYIFRESFSLHFAEFVVIHCSILCCVFFISLSSTSVLCIVVFNTYYVFVLVILCCLFSLSSSSVHCGVQHILCCRFSLSSSSVLCIVVSNTYYVVVLVCLRHLSCALWCPTHIMLSF